MVSVRDHHPLLKFYGQVLSLIGLWKIPSEWSLVQMCSYMLYKCTVLLMICGFIAALAADIYLCKDDLLIMTDDGCILVGLFLILFKLLNFQVFPDEVQTLLNFVDENILAIHTEGNAEHLKIWRSYFLRERLTIYGFASIGMFLIFALMFLTPTELGELPIRSQYPFDATKSPLYQLMFTYQGIVLLVAMLSILTMDNICYTFCSQIFCYFDILKLDFGKCALAEARSEDEEDKTRTRKRNSCNNFKENFSRCIQRHQRIIESAENVDKFLSPLMFVQLMASNILICLTGFQAILGAGQNSDVLKFGVYLSAAFFQLFVYCWFGNELIFKSTSVADVLWSSQWELENITSIKSLITIPLIRVRRPLKLTAGKFYVMSMESFISVLSGSYSYFTLLTKMNEPEDKE